jgi:transposase-like protein
MQQIYHSNAKTNVNNRCLIKNSRASNKALCERFNVSEPTIIKWKNRAELTDKSSKPTHISYALSAVEKAIIISSRRSTWMPLDDVLEVVQQINPIITRSSVYRLLLSEKINIVSQEQKLKANKFKEYKPGYLHIDVTYLPKFDGQKHYLFVAIDRATRVLFYQIYGAKTALNTNDFVNKCNTFFPFSITHILTDNGLEFTNKLLVSKKGTSTEKDSLLDVFCAEKNIEHRLTKPATPKTNGMVERVNGTIKSNTILKDTYADLSEMNQKMLEFLTYYLLHRRHAGLVKELKIKTPMQAIEKWFLIEPQLFKDNPETFKQKITNLTLSLSKVKTKQPCET